MTRLEKNALYDKICHSLTDYEHSEDTEEVNAGFLEEFYRLLVEVQGYWDELTFEDESL